MLLLYLWLLYKLCLFIQQQDKKKLSERVIDTVCNTSWRYLLSFLVNEVNVILAFRRGNNSRNFGEVGPAIENSEILTGETVYLRNYHKNISLTVGLSIESSNDSIFDNFWCQLEILKIQDDGIYFSIKLRELLKYDEVHALISCIDINHPSISNIFCCLPSEEETSFLTIFLDAISIPYHLRIRWCLRLNCIYIS